MSPPPAATTHRCGDGCAATWSCPACTSPREYGGAGGTLVEAAIVFEELGRALTPVPLAATTFAIEAVLRMGDEEQRRRLLPGLLSGERIGAFAAAGPDAADTAAATVLADTVDGRTVLTGECVAGAARLTSPTCSSCPRAADGAVTSTWWPPMLPGSRSCACRRSTAPGPSPRLQLRQGTGRGTGRRLPDEFDRVLDVARVLLAAEMLGGAEACLAHGGRLRLQPTGSSIGRSARFRRSSTRAPR